ncbi:YhgE/Pip family protein [Levilactobacillus fuyuanensis]|uniref:YhgE/Pip family protein n=1 Tax=Levilactobacillus fuyuanensis TaxID=2486022 RepID=A0ABW4H2K9_9LACO|nr:YhgE/Pip family protein [Levilactobacillus fuyuanensis]
MLMSEWHYLLRHKISLVVLVMIALIPAIYCYLYLSSMWNTYGHTDDIPVAIVNHDRAVHAHGQTIAIGQRLTTNLKHTKDLDFHKLSAATAHDHLKSGRLYLVVTIPADFSHNAITLLTQHPQRMQLHYSLNSGQNFIVSKMTTGIASAITTKINRDVIRLNSQILLTALHNASVGMRHAARGNTQLVQGTQQLQQGNQRLQAAMTSISNVPLTKGLFTTGAGLNHIQLGASTLATALSLGSTHLQANHTSSTNANAIAQPVTSTSHDIAKVPNNGTGMAPFAIAIGLYVGGIALGTMYDAGEWHRKPQLAITWWGSKAAIIGGVALIQSSLLFGTLRLANNLKVQSQAALFCAILLGSLLFLSLIFCLRILLGGFGTWLISIVLVLQLASSGGLYPTALVSSLAQHLNPWLPMTYLIDLLRSAISTNVDTNTAWGLILLMIIGFNLLIILRFHLLLKRDPLAN